MMNLIKMECYKLRTSKLFMILLAVAFAANLLFSLGAQMLPKLFVPNMPVEATPLSSVLAQPFGLSLLMIIVFVSAVSFMSLDYSGGFIKNIAGQVGDRGKIVIAKFIAVGIHNLIFFIVGVISSLLGTLIAGQITADAAVMSGILTLLLKWFLSMALSSILLFFAVGIRNKTLATIIGVVLSLNALSLAYLGVNTLVANVFKINDFDFGSFMPDALMNSVSVVNNELVVNAIVVGAIFIALFVTLTYITFKKRDVK